MAGGWIRLHRQIQESPLWRERPFDRARAWVDLLLLANFTEGTIRKRGIKVPVERGQVGLSERELGERWGWSRGKVRRFLDELETVQQIEPQNGPQKKNVTTLITITNYDRDQTDEPQNGPANGTTNGPQTGHRMTKVSDSAPEFPSKKEKKDKEKTLSFPDMNFPEDFQASERFRGVWADWIRFRRELKKPLKPTTVERQAKMLAKLGIDGAIHVIERSITNGWTGLFPPNEKDQQEPIAGPQIDPQHQADALERRRRYGLA